VWLRKGAIRVPFGALLPHVDTRPEFSWAACFGASDTGLPSIGAVPGAKRCFAVLGYGGNGITFSTVAAQLIQRAVVGLRDPDEDLFAFPGRLRRHPLSFGAAMRSSFTDRLVALAALRRKAPR
jgi:glycine/D-amino acid oxidase-like deaminating enzyme